MPKNKLIDLSGLSAFKENIKNLFTNLTGDLTLLDTIRKDNLVSAINEINSGFTNTTTTGIVGEIKSYMGTTPPESFLSCDGAIYNIANYPYLAQHFLINFGKTNFFGGDGVDTFAVPDLRGEFLRGTGTNGHSGEGSGSGVGSHQGSTIFPYYGGSANTSYVVSQKTPSNFDAISRNSSYYFTSVNKSGDAVSQSFTARPTNTSVLYCIRYKPAFMADNEGMLELATEIEQVREKTVTVKTLTATEEGAPLDATMGKVLDDKIDKIKIKSVYGNSVVSSRNNSTAVFSITPAFDCEEVLAVIPLGVSCSGGVWLINNKILYSSRSGKTCTFTIYTYDGNTYNYTLSYVMLYR